MAGKLTYPSLIVPSFVVFALITILKLSIVISGSSFPPKCFASSNPNF